jgi:pimeloyl-ACP methyl ester carboxylesterase
MCLLLLASQCRGGGGRPKKLLNTRTKVFTRLVAITLSGDDPGAFGSPKIRQVRWLPSHQIAQVCECLVLDTEPPTVLNQAQLATAKRRAMEGHGMNMAWAFFWDDIDDALIRDDLVDFPLRNGVVPPWGSSTLPLAVAASSLTPGAIASEAAAVTVPVLVAMGQRDVVADPKGEPRAYLSSTSVDVFVCPQMGHMHNFASTRELLWKRIEHWANWVGANRDMSFEPRGRP